MNKQDLIVSWRMFQREHGSISVDRMICDPKLRDEFLEAVKPSATEVEEKQILWDLMGLRKRKELSKSQKLFCSSDQRCHEQ